VCCHLAVFDAAIETLYQEIRVAVKEEGHTISPHPGFVYNAMQIRDITAIGPTHDQVTRIDDNCIWDWFNINPLSGFAVSNLQTARRVLKEDCDSTEVSVSTNAFSNCQCIEDNMFRNLDYDRILTSF
jgi:hypothetical protein